MNEAQIIDSKSTPTESVPEHIRIAARAADSWEVVHRPDNKGTFPARVEEARPALKRLEGQLAQLPISAAEAGDRPTPHHSALLDLRGNPRLLRAAVTAVADRPSLVA